jgi:Skp family chaperone for outer membrane proteins
MRLFILALALVMFTVLPAMAANQKSITESNSTPAPQAVKAEGKATPAAKPVAASSENAKAKREAMQAKRKELIEKRMANKQASEKRQQASKEHTYQWTVGPVPKTYELR